MKRRTLFALGLGSLVTAVGGRSLYRRGIISALGSAQDLTFQQDETVLRFAAIGDVGTGHRGQYAVARAMNRHWRRSPFPLTLMTGDNIYSAGEIEKVNKVFERPYANLLQNNVKFRAVLGNHDFQTNRGIDQIAYSGYNMPARYYTFSQQPVQFFALDTNLAKIQNQPGEALWQEQLEWLRKELEQSSARWKVVFGHHQVYSSGRYSSDIQLVRELSPIFSEYGVQLYINGHEHHYERTNPINGTTYVTSGNGAKLRPVGSSGWTAHASSQLGFTTFSVYSDRMVISAVDTSNRIYDEGVLL
ncbi:MAG: metallophosphoesterase [Cyanobacteria bacterium J06621_3]